MVQLSVDTHASHSGIPSRWNILVPRGYSCNVLMEGLRCKWALASSTFALQRNVWSAARPSAKRIDVAGCSWDMFRSVEYVCFTALACPCRRSTACWFPAWLAKNLKDICRGSVLFSCGPPREVYFFVLIPGELERVAGRMCFDGWLEIKEPQHQHHHLASWHIWLHSPNVIVLLQSLYQRTRAASM